MNKWVEDQMAALRVYWLQSAYQYGEKTSASLIIVPGVKLHGYNKIICTVLFVAPPGYPGACPVNFWTDVQGLLLLKPRKEIYPCYDGYEIIYTDIPKNINEVSPIPGAAFSHWKDLTWWSWHLQSWNPNTCTLLTYMRVIKKRLFPAM